MRCLVVSLLVISLAIPAYWLHADISEIGPAESAIVGSPNLWGCLVPLSFPLLLLLLLVLVVVSWH